MKILIVSAPFALDRRAKAVEFATKSGLPYEIVEGVNGDMLDVSLIPREGWGLQLKPRVVACYLSHLQALGRARELGEKCLIVEDDWKPLRPVAEAISEVPECDYLVMHGLNYDGAPGVVADTGPGWEKLSPPPIIALGYVPGPRFLDAALAEAFPVRDHVDHFFRNTVIKHGLTSYRPTPAAITGAGFPSTLGH